MENQIITIMEQVFGEKVQTSAILHVYGAMDEFRTLAERLEEDLGIEVSLAYEDPFAMGELTVEDFVKQIQ